MRLLRFVAVACMVTVGVVSLGCGESTTVVDKPAEKPAATSPAESTPKETPEKATAGTTPVSLTITGMA